MSGIQWDWQSKLRAPRGEGEKKKEEIQGTAGTQWKSERKKLFYPQGITRSKNTGILQIALLLLLSSAEFFFFFFFLLSVPYTLGRGREAATACSQQYYYSVRGFRSAAPGIRLGNAKLYGRNVPNSRDPRYCFRVMAIESATDENGIFSFSFWGDYTGVLFDFLSNYRKWLWISYNCVIGTLNCSLPLS